MSEIKSEMVISDTNLEEFKKLVRRAVFLTHEEDPIFQAVPNHTWRKIFSVNFHGNFEYARRVLLNQFKEIERIDTVNVDREKNKIFNLERATKFVTDAIDKGEKILFVTDFDNDGSLAQAVINEYLAIDTEAAKNMYVEYAQIVNGNSNRGFTVDHIDLMVSSKGVDPNSAFLIVTADNGINSREEQQKILAKYPKARIVVTDHHNPDPEMVIEENDRSVIFNPHYNPTPFFKKFNISGATTCGVLMKHVLTKRFTPIELGTYQKNFEKLHTLFKVANLLDYVNTHPADKPEKDYIITKFVQLQPLMNINNSISKIITGEIPASAIIALEKKIPQLDVNLIYEEAKNIHTQNMLAKILLNIYKNRNAYVHIPLPENIAKEAKKEARKAKAAAKDVITEEELPIEEVVLDDKPKDLDRDDFNRIFLAEIKNSDNYTDHSNINPNYIEQLRPIIFGLAADYNKTAFLDSVEQKMVEVFESIRLSEKRMGEELRRGEVITKTRLENSVIAYADPHILSIFNRKFLNKVYNDENPGFSLTLDSIGKGKASGSFRSLYDISDILKDKAKLEKMLHVKIDTPGHERAAGFVIKSKDPEKYPVTANTIETINSFINDSISVIRQNEIDNTADYLLTDLNAIEVIDRLNRTIRGNISNFEKITPILQLNKDMVYTDSYTTEQFTMEELVAKRKYGYITINMDFHGRTIIIPVELIRRIVENNYKDYLSLGYMDAGVFMVDRVVPEKQASHIIDLRTGNHKTKALVEAWELDFMDKNHVELNRDQIADNPFFKYHDYGNLNFQLFEKMVIGIIDTNKVDTLAVFDVEANGFGNSKLMNIGSTNYSVDPISGASIKSKEFFQNLYHTSRKEDYLLTDADIKNLIEILPADFASIPVELQKTILHKYDAEMGILYFMPKNAEKLAKAKTLPFVQVRNYFENEDGIVTFNREIRATMLAYLVKDKDFRVPQEMINLTGITQEVLEKYGKETHVVDKEMCEFYKDKKVLFGAHNTPYDARVSRANLPGFYEVLKSNKIYDSALFAKKEMLAYDSVVISSIPILKDITGKEILFYNNPFSDFNLTKFITDNRTGYFPDRTNNYLLEIDQGEYYLVDKVQHEKIKIDINQVEMLESLKEVHGLGSSVQYSVEKMSEQWMIHALLLNDEKFNVKLIDLENSNYESLKPYAESIKYFQENYHFDISPMKNIENFSKHHMTDVLGSITSPSSEDDEEDNDVQNIQAEELAALCHDFLQLNRDIAQKFCDAWMYKRVLSIKDPAKDEVNKDLIELVHYQTHIPKEKIMQIFNEAIAFKKKYQIDHIMQHEMHANGPWRTDFKGDIAFEDKLTLCLLANKEYNPYSHDISHALKTFHKFQIEARLHFEVADGLGDSLAQDSYSFRQGILYEREIVTPMIKKIQEREELLKEKGRHVIKFKLSNDVLPDKTAVYALLKDKVVLTRDDIEKHKEMFDFILLNEQLRTSRHNAPANLVETLLEIYENNSDKIIEYKKELAKFYDFVEYNKKEYQMKQFLDKAIEIGIFGEMPKRQPKAMILESADMGSVLNVKNIFENMVAAAESLNTMSELAKPEHVALVQKMIDLRLGHPEPTELEVAVENKKRTFRDFERVNEPHFLNSVDIIRKTPLTRLLDKHHEYRMLNGIVEKYEEFALDNQQQQTVKVKAKMR